MAKPSLENDLRAVMLTAEGRRLLRWIIYDPECCGLLTDPWRDVERDTDHSLGRQSIGLTLNDLLEHALPGSTLEVLAAQADVAEGAHDTGEKP